MAAPHRSPDRSPTAPPGDLPLDRAPRALVVYESLFGATAAVADGIVDGLTAAGFIARALPVSSPAVLVPVRVDLLVVGAPTHLLSLSRRVTRDELVHLGADPAAGPFGLREWLDDVRPSHLGTTRAAVFDTRARAQAHLPLGAAPTAARMLRRHGFDVAEPLAHFHLHRGHLLPGEAGRARTWGAATGRGLTAGQRLSSPA